MILRNLTIAICLAALVACGQAPLDVSGAGYSPDPAVSSSTSTGPVPASTPDQGAGDATTTDDEVPANADVSPTPEVAPTLPAPVCGNDKIETDEECDGSDLNSSTCSTFGYSLGSLSCSGTCKFNKAGCSNPPPASVCGNGTKETGEQCDDGNVSNWDGCNAACEVEPDPTLQSDFSTIAGFVIKKKQAAASIVFGQSDTEAEDNNVVSLMFAGDPALGPPDNKGPKYATEIATQQSLHFGTYRTRVRFAECDSTEELVNGIFLYSYGGDTNGNGITDNNEIDFEILCGEPQYLWMTTWTDYPDVGEPAGSERLVSHVINMETGDYYQSDPANDNHFDKLGTNANLIVPGFAGSGEFYEIGFEWSSDHIRFFMEKDGNDVTLWDYSDTTDKTQTYIPQNPATFRYNVWHTGSHWWVGGAADYPSNSAAMFVDFFKYWAE